MNDLNKIKEQLKNIIFEEKLCVSKKFLNNLKIDLFQVLKKYTNLSCDSININIKLSNLNKYLIYISTEIDDIYDN